MSSSVNHNKRNLFELKHQNRYAQLVEAQSPEPQQAIEGETEQRASQAASCDEMADRAEQVANPSPLNEDSDAERADQQQQQQQYQQQSSFARKVSQTSSQISTSFMSTTSSFQPSSMAETQRLHTVSSTATTTSGLGAGHLTNGGSTSGHGTNLTRTISRSMLELDKSVRLDRFEVSWSELSFGYKPKWLSGGGSEPAHVLRNLSGSFKSNQLVAIIGPSGCGKTTLLQFLAGNNPEKRDKVRIVGLDEPKVAFIGQGDCLLPGLTARETLIYASRLQNAQANFDHLGHVQPILRELGLAECADRSVTKLSGGQAKRVTIAQELLYPTNLLILDEVTSGLDASTSYSIVRLLKQLVSDLDYPMSIVISIHQPSAKLFSVFDQVYVMSEGHCLYEGSCQVDTINAHLSRFGLECPKFHNIADYLIEIASEDLKPDDGERNFVKEQLIQFQEKRSQMSSSTFQEAKAGDQFLDADSSMKETSSLKQSTDADRADEADGELRVAMLAVSHSLYDAVERARGRRERPLFGHFLVHLFRSLLRIRRSHILTYLQLITYILLGLQLATFYGPNIGSLSGCPRLPQSFMSFVFASDSDPDSDVTLEMRRIQENMNFLLVAIMTATFAALEITVITFPMEAKTVKREWRNGWYRVSSYFLGRTIADLPFQLVFVVAFCLVIYTLTGQIGLDTWRFGSFVTIIVMTALIAQTVGFIFGALFMNNLPAAVFTAPLCIFPALLFSGFFSRVSQIPSFYKPMTYLSHYRYAFDALLVTLYGYDRCKCDSSLLQSYHEGLQNQTSTIRTMFSSLFGSVDCGPTAMNPEENSIEDFATSNPTDIPFHSNHTASQLYAATNHTTTSSSFKPFEDALVDHVFDQIMHTTESSSADANGGATAMDRLVQKFSTRVTSMLNSRSNYGHQVPTDCKDFNSYLMTEFDLHNNDLIYGLVMLFVFVLVSRLICNAILAFTIATRTR